MSDFSGIESALSQIADGCGRRLAGLDAAAAAAKLVALGEMILATWVEAKGQTPTSETKEGFRLLALQRQGAKGDPSFHACRETARELAYHYNLIVAEPEHPDTDHRLTMMSLVARHLLLFVQGKLENAGLGQFCCAAQPVRASDATGTDG